VAYDIGTGKARDGDALDAAQDAFGFDEATGCAFG